MAFLSSSVLLLTASVWLTAIAFVALKRLYLDPLAKIPGPKLAALTSLYEFYYDCWLGGKFAFKLVELHERYGPIVRISPREVHISDPNFLDTLYNVTGKLDKDGWYYRFIGSQDSFFGSSSADLHRMRRKAVSRFFSASAISNIESSSRKSVDTLSRRLGEFRDRNEPVNLSNAFRCLAADSVTEYCLPEPFHLLDSWDFAEDYNRQARGLSWIAVWHRHIPIIFPIFLATPRWLVKLTSSEGGLLTFDFQTGLTRQSERVVKSEKRSDKTVLDGIVNADIPESEKTVDRVNQEARTIIGAGTETTGAALETISWFVLTNPDVKARLKAELTEMVSKGHRIDSSEALKKLPYLTAVIKEGLRLTNSVSGRMPRIDPKQSHTYGSYVIPSGTVMSMSLSSIHFDPKLYPDPYEFRPERWLKDANAESLEKWFAPFGRGARSCIGKELAWMNLFLAAANFFYYFDAVLYQTTYAAIAMEHDYFAPFPHKDSQGLRVMLK